MTNIGLDFTKHPEGPGGEKVQFRDSVDAGYIAIVQLGNAAPKATGIKKAVEDAMDTTATPADADAEGPAIDNINIPAAELPRAREIAGQLLKALEPRLADAREKLRAERRAPGDNYARIVVAEKTCKALEGLRGLLTDIRSYGIPYKETRHDWTAMHMTYDPEAAQPEFPTNKPTRL